MVQPFVPVLMLVLRIRLMHRLMLGVMLMLGLRLRLRLRPAHGCKYNGRERDREWVDLP